MGNKLAIKGHSTRGNEVIEILKMLGGNSFNSLMENTRPNRVYYIGNNNAITWKEIYSDNSCLETEDFFTLEEFLEKYPFKVGDKVTLDNKLCSIIWMCWECNKIYYVVQGTNPMFTKKVTANELKPYKETNMNENKFPSFEPMFKINDEIEYKIPDGYKISVVSKDWVSIKPIKPKYPKTYKECCDVLLIPPYYNLRYHTYERGYNEYATSNTLLSLQDKLNTLGKLIICRDAYWKIAGEEMGLGKPWEPDWTNLDQLKYCIWFDVGEIITMTNVRGQHILAFPTEEIRDAFYENFNDLIEQSKKLL